MYRKNIQSNSPSFNRKPSFGRGRPSHGGPRRFGGGKTQRIDVSKFVSKAVITENVPHFVPEHAFKDFKIDERLKGNITSKGYITPTPIQDRIIPHVLRGEDVVGIANTGTGKTGAFLIPLINKVLHNPKENILIVVPTRELALQIQDELVTFAKNLKIFSVCCVGGAPIGRQISGLRYHNNFIIGTPGRLKDLIERKFINPAGFNTIVLDEADRMLDMGFVHDMRHLMAQMPKVRHTLFFSATVSSEISGLIREFLKEPATISVKTGDTAKNVDQDVVKLKHGDQKIEVLHNLLTQSKFNKVLIFGRTKHGVEKLSKVLAERGFKVESIHGNKNQSRRQRALNLFKDNHIQILVATDVAARGLDIADVSHVINYDIPATYDDYVHRIGRTGRGGKKGQALTFIES
ncbi:MAG: DEAD/DEAH box helicase [Candidatus Taylorbacteria bacterium]